jgi:hypothetical protein
MLVLWFLRLTVRMRMVRSVGRRWSRGAALVGFRVGPGGGSRVVRNTLITD